jgi:hypothetical protein
VFIAGRLVRVADGAASQTVNICTSANVPGQYEHKVRLRPPYVSAQELEQRGFGSVEELVRYLVGERGGVVERAPQRPAEGSEGRPRSVFEQWTAKWKELANWAGLPLEDENDGIRSALALWREPISGSWMRGVDSQLLGPRYRRGDVASPHRGEHAIEAAVLDAGLGEARCGWGSVVDGVNAFPLTTDSEGGRRGNIEADLLLLVHGESGYRQLVVEVKDASNDP